MWFRRVFYWVQLGAVIVLPLWIVAARSLSSAGLGALDVLVFLSWPSLALAMIVVVGLSWARKAVRDTRTLSWLDVGVLSAWYLVAIVFGVFIAVSSELGVGLAGGLLFLVSIGVFWVAVWQLVNAARERVRTVLAGLDYTAIPAGDYQASRFGRGDGDVIKIDPSRR